MQRHLGTAESSLLRALVWVGRECLSRGLNPDFITQLTAPVSRLSSTLRLFGQPLLSHIIVVYGFPPSQAVISDTWEKDFRVNFFCTKKKFYQDLKHSNFNFFSWSPQLLNIPAFLNICIWPGLRFHWISLCCSPVSYWQLILMKAGCETIGRSVA